MENKKSYFFLDLKIPDAKTGDKKYKDALNNSVDLILSAMGAENEPEQYLKNDDARMLYFFRTNERKRKGQLVKFCERYLPEYQDYRIEGITKAYLEEQKLRLKNSNKYEKKSNKIGVTSYKGNDIKVLDERKNWKPWQVEIFNKFFNEDLSIKPTNEREIYSIINIEGQSGKSIFYKWLYVNVGEDKIGAVTFGTASQLRASIFNLGEKKMYILDLTRAKGKADREEDLMSVLEATKNGMVTTFGKGKTLLMEPPHILITSNYLLDYELLSMDRWKIYELKTNGELGKENAILTDKSERRRLLQRQHQLAKERQSVKKL
jgi:hypothetical protein